MSHEAGPPRDEPTARGRTRLAAVFSAVLGITYPLVILLCLTHLTPRRTAFVILALGAIRFGLARPNVGRAAIAALAWPALGIGLVVGATAYWNDPLGLLLAPALVNLALLASFGLSLRSERPMVERFARLQVPDLPPDEQAYCRNVTLVWCAFFVVNGAICLALALGGSLRAWTIFTGGVSYLLIGLLFAVEYVYRHARFRRYRGGLLDPLLRRVFPARDPA